MKRETPRVLPKQFLRAPIFPFDAVGLGPPPCSNGLDPALEGVRDMRQRIGGREKELGDGGTGKRIGMGQG
eukprot:5254170-Pyramimonas_sp.AAC.1